MAGFIVQAATARMWVAVGSEWRVLNNITCYCC